jgi:hypothetical protein
MSRLLAFAIGVATGMAAALLYLLATDELADEFLLDMGDGAR